MKAYNVIVGYNAFTPAFTPAGWASKMESRAEAIKMLHDIRLYASKYKTGYEYRLIIVWEDEL